MGKRVSYKSIVCVVVVCILAVNLRSVVFSSPEDEIVQVLSVVELDTPTSPQSPPFQNYFPDLDEDSDKEPQPAPLGTHEYGDNGLLVVNPDGPHPIFELIQQAEEAWARKLDRASKTLEEAVEEYERRYKRPPPLHFEKWYVFNMQVKVKRA